MPKEAARDRSEGVTTARAMIDRLFPYVCPTPAALAVADQELLACLCRENLPVHWENLSLDRLLANPRFDAVGGSLERLEAAGAVKTWPTQHDGRMVAVTEAGRIAYGFYQTMVAPGWRTTPWPNSAGKRMALSRAGNLPPCPNSFPTPSR